MNSSLLKYYHEVLGVQFLPRDLFVVPEEASTPVAASFWRETFQDRRNEAPKVQGDLLFVSCLDSENEESLFQEPHRALFEKMKKAMELPEIKTVTLEYVGPSTHDLFRDLLQMQFKVVVLLKNNPERSDFKICPEFKFMETHSPQTLSQQTSLKKEAWDDLQKIMKVFKN